MKTKTLFNRYTPAFASLLLAVVLSGCGETETEKYDRFMSELECPVVLIGKTDKAVTYPSIVVRDAKGRIRTLAASVNGDGWKMPSAIADSRNIGDTLKPCH
jgi:uncharacterized lipoprotein YehR (DUF1307 family)